MVLTKFAEPFDIKSAPSNSQQPHSRHLDQPTHHAFRDMIIVSLPRGLLRRNQVLLPRRQLLHAHAVALDFALGVDLLHLSRLVDLGLAGAGRDHGGLGLGAGFGCAGGDDELIGLGLDV